jgi:hypothetical protein
MVNAIANLLAALVAARHVYFLVLEMFPWTKPLGRKTFHNTPEKAADSAVLAAVNQRFSRPRRGLRGLSGKMPLMAIINERSRWSFRLVGCGSILTRSVQMV